MSLDEGKAVMFTRRRVLEQKQELQASKGMDLWPAQKTLDKQQSESRAS